MTPKPQNLLVRVRHAAPDDIPFMMRIERDCPTAAHWTEQQYRELFDAAAGHWPRLALLAESAPSDSQSKSPPHAIPLGFLVARHLAPEWELENIVVAVSNRRSGVGEQLLERLLNGAGETQSVSIFLEVRESNVAAKALYEKLGFRATGRRKSYYNNPLEDSILYSLDLRPERR